MTRPLPPCRASRQRLPRSFRLLVAGQALSLIGSQVTLLALPLIAIQLNNAQSFETGVLLACGRAPYLLLGLLAGVAADRVAHWMLLVVANAAMALTLATLPLTALLDGHIGMAHLYLVATLVGAAAVVADIAFLACVPTVVGPQQLVQAQSRMELAQSAALVVGLPLAGWLVATFSAPVAILADSASFLLAVALLPHAALRSARNAPALADRHARQAGGAIWRLLGEAADGVLFTLRSPSLRAVTLATGTFVFCYSAYSAVFLLYLSRDLGLSAGMIGTVTGIAATGSVLGALIARRVAQALGLGRTLTAALLTSAIGAVLGPSLHGAGWLALGLSQVLIWAGQQVYNVHQVPIRYALAPVHLHGRVNASIRTVVWSLAPLGALLGGACGMWSTPRTTLLLSGALMAAAAGWIVASPLWAVRVPQLGQGHAAVPSTAASRR
ncbi:MFS transporter [Xanthomonas sacchari]|uniref:MFS transporter n=1 Tax=Xanthomonas sacchari TaxID=56458 RepID=UPI0020C3E4E8|nr:MFS transporter [Xanthomonas sacchari]